MSLEKPTVPIDEYGRYPGISRPALPSSRETECSEGRVQIPVEFFNRIYRDRRKGDNSDPLPRDETIKSSESDYDVKRAKPKTACSVTSPLRRGDSLIGQEFNEDRKVTLSELGASTLLPSSMYLMWRVFVLMFSCMVMTWTTLVGPSLGMSIPLTSSILSFFMASKMVFWTLLHRKWRVNHEKLAEQRKEYRWDALIFQTNFHLSFMSAIAILICSLFGNEDGKNQNPFLQNNLGFNLTLVNGIVLLADVVITAIPFHLVSVLIAAGIVTGLAFITHTVRPSTTIERQTVVWTVGAMSLVVGFALHATCRAARLRLGKRNRSKGRDDSRGEETPRGFEII